MIQKNDSEILKELAKRYSEIANSEKNDEKRKLYLGINSLKNVRPAVLIDELPWHEMNVEGQLDLICEGEEAKKHETALRRKLFRHKYFRADTFYQKYISVGKIIEYSSMGVELQEKTVSTDSRNHIVSHQYFDLMKNEDDLNKLKNPEVFYNKEKTMERFHEAQEVFEGILPVKLSGVQCHWNPWDDIARLKGVEPLLLALVDQPDFMHQLMEKLFSMAMSRFDQYEKLGLLQTPEYFMHCTAGLNEDLAAEDAEETTTTKKMWGRGTAQIFGSVSKEMHDEFDISYMVRLMERFGAVYYGCCEPLHNKIDIVSKIPNLRKISITPWADVDIAAEAIGNKYVFASKPNPAYVAELSFDADRVRKEITQVLNACKRNGTTCEFVIKDISTCKNRPQNIFEWEKTVMETVINF